ncbi:hypothetical protein BFF78_08310 [Streptomyces fodineus]|uniref:Uncharacterized protein n=1 Tax=Streptomyces fodineus TaxID=1904616 RepID=A0A1D7Y636_9ACTN|nr:hypothetical protein [Streptomyces fodineus]AOR31042.1 hypothetical protein BFF78_08310 [Streptomyces fodineus]
MAVVLDATMLNEASGIAGSARRLLAEGAVHPDPEAAVFAAMMEDWAAQQHTPFLNSVGTRKRRGRLVRRLAMFTGTYPWQWQVAKVDAFFTMLPCLEPKLISVSTGRGHEDALRLFLEYVTDPCYAWPRATFVVSRHMSSAPSRCGAEFTPPIAVDRYRGGYLHSHLIT